MVPDGIASAHQYLISSSHGNHGLARGMDQGRMHTGTRHQTLARANNSSTTMHCCPTGWPLEVRHRHQVCRRADGSGNWQCATGWAKTDRSPWCIKSSARVSSTEADAKSLPLFGATERPSTDVAASKTSAASALDHLLVILRGEIFRSGGQHSRTSTLQARPQLLALDSVRRNLDLAKQMGWSYTVIMDVAAPSAHHEGTFRRLANATFGKVTIHIAPLAETQLRTVARTLVWALASVQRTWTAALLLRSDLLIKSLPLPPPTKLGCAVLVPFETLDGQGGSSWRHTAVHETQHTCAHARADGRALSCTLSTVAGVSDTIWLLPWCRYSAVLRLLTARAARVNNVGNRSSHLDHLHGLCDWGVSDVAFMTPRRYDANSERDHNPIYRMVGRKEQRTGRVEGMIRRKYGSGYGRPRNRGAKCKRRDSFCVHSSCGGDCPNQTLARLQAQRIETAVGLG